MPIGKATEPLLASRARLLTRGQLKIRDLLSDHSRQGSSWIVRPILVDRPLLMASTTRQPSSVGTALVHLVSGAVAPARQRTV